ncbi:ATP-dependent RecD-like DNA helicase [Dictyobacter vulcani]|uniref:ATP-dependent RecD-like DNA helicase n=1 Tax=Dictyobacter vulcani TaxID=2607529 RepID=A0A5J4KEM1_9CHLR|nr:AAA family ATPase [Dictyobacter vulcani]GER85973.1 ATP-dependent RecD-like DNA helicase [Dictyobacter vulcani]
MPKLEGSVENIVFHNEENQYTVARFRLNDRGRLFRDDLTTIVGVLPGIHPGELLSLEGEWESDPRYGRQLKVTSFVQRLPASTEGMVRYLSSGFIKGIGPKKAQAIVDHFGEQTLAIIEQQPELLTQVKGISSKDCERIEKAWLEQEDVKELHLFLQSHEVSMSVATRIYKEYGRESIRVVRENPYQLADHVSGIGFRTADDIAVKLGLPQDSLARLATGLKYVLTQAANEDGHCFLLESDLIRRAAHILEVPSETLQGAMEQLHSEQDVFIEPPTSSLEPMASEKKPGTTSEEIGEDDADTLESSSALESRIYFGPFWYAENGSMRLLRILRNAPSCLPPTSQKQWEIVFERLSQQRKMELTERQREAVQVGYQQKVSILTGGPGTGKSTSLRALLMLLRTRKVDVALAAPTGRAAKRLTEATGVQAKTLHRLLEYAPHDNSYQRNEENPLPFQFVIIDEFSMVDILLFYHLLKALPRTSHLLLVGDADQLPSVGPGNVLRDLLRSQAIPAVRLTDLFRQAQQSRIVVTAHQINQGIVPTPKIEAHSDFFFMKEEDPFRAQQLVLDLVQRRLPAKYHFNPISDIQVLAPMYKGPLASNY